MEALTPSEREELHDAPQPRAVRGPSHDEQRLAAREEDGQAGERLLDVALVDARLVLCRREARGVYLPSVHAVGRGAAMLGERHQPESRLLARRLLAPLRPARHGRVLGARRLLLITPRVAQKGGHFPHRRRLRARVERRPCWWRSRVVGEVRGVQPAGGQAAEELRGTFEGGVGVAAADERRDRRRLFRLGASPAQAPQAAVGAATVAGRGESGDQEAGDAGGRRCPVIVVDASLDVVCDAEPSEEHAENQEEEADHGPQPPQGGAGLHGAIAAAAQRGGERAGRGEVQRSECEAICSGYTSGECCDDGERPVSRNQDDANGAHYADGACVGREEGEEEEAEEERVQHEPPHVIANGGFDRLARRQHDRRARKNHK
eukprot:scaffold23007_cov60-Phaeocystis_antarctica.AAC.12